MGSIQVLYSVLLSVFIGLCALYQCSGIEGDTNQTALLFVNASEASARKIPETLFGIFFEEINHAGSGGLWAELVANRGFEAGGWTTPSNIAPWLKLGDERSIVVSTDHTSCFVRNKIALSMEILCDSKGPMICPVGGVGVYNPGFWGMNIEEGKSYKLVLYVRSLCSINISASLTDPTGLQTLAATNIIVEDVSNWTKMQFCLVANASNPNSRLQLTTTQKGVIWFDQVSLVPLDTFKGHGFRNDLFKMIADLNPAFMRFPDDYVFNLRGTFVEGDWLRNAFRWKETIGTWEERPGHLDGSWDYWTDDGLGFFEYFQLAEDLGALPVWVFNAGISRHDEVNTSNILPFIQEILDGLEFVRGDANSTWGSVRAAMGHPEPFNLRYVAIGNEDCEFPNYLGNYLKFYKAIKCSYPDIKIISNCNAPSKELDHPADMYDYHIYTNASTIFSGAHVFDYTSRSGPKAFVSEYAVRDDAGNGNILAAVAEAGFLIGLERNSDVVEMASYAPLFVNAHDSRWNPDAVVFNSAQVYGTPSYWMQRFFKMSNGATLLNSTLQANSSTSLAASAIICKNIDGAQSYLILKVVNFGSSSVNLKISIDGLELDSVGSKKVELRSNNVMDENSFKEPRKVGPVKSGFEFAGCDMDVTLSPYSLTMLVSKSRGIAKADACLRVSL